MRFFSSNFHDRRQDAHTHDSSWVKKLKRNAMVIHERLRSDTKAKRASKGTKREERRARREQHPAALSSTLTTDEIIFGDDTRSTESPGTVGTSNTHPIPPPATIIRAGSPAECLSVLHTKVEEACCEVTVSRVLLSRSGQPGEHLVPCGHASAAVSKICIGTGPVNKEEPATFVLQPTGLPTGLERKRQLPITLSLPSISLPFPTLGPGDPESSSTGESTSTSDSSPTSGTSTSTSNFSTTSAASASPTQPSLTLTGTTEPSGSTSDPATTSQAQSSTSGPSDEPSAPPSSSSESSASSDLPPTSTAEPSSSETSSGSSAYITTMAPTYTSTDPTYTTTYTYTSPIPLYTTESSGSYTYSYSDSWTDPTNINTYTSGSDMSTWSIPSSSSVSLTSPSSSTFVSLTLSVSSTQSDAPSGPLNSDDTNTRPGFANNTGAIIGVAVAVAIGLALAGVAIFFACKRLRKRSPTAAKLAAAVSRPAAAGTGAVFGRGTSGPGGGAREFSSRSALVARSPSSWRPVLSDEDSLLDSDPDGLLGIRRAGDSSSSLEHTSSGDVTPGGHAALLQQIQQHQKAEWAAIAAASPPSLLNPPMPGPSRNPEMQEGPVPGLLLPPRPTFAELRRAPSGEGWTPGTEMLPHGLMANPGQGSTASLVDHMDYTRPMKPFVFNRMDSSTTLGSAPSIRPSTVATDGGGHTSRPTSERDH